MLFDPKIVKIMLFSGVLFHAKKETFEKPQHCHCEQSEAISKHVDNPQDCHVALLLAMTRIDQNEGCAKLSKRDRASLYDDELR